MAAPPSAVHGTWLSVHLMLHVLRLSIRATRLVEGCLLRIWRVRPTWHLLYRCYLFCGLWDVVVNLHPRLFPLMVRSFAFRHFALLSGRFLVVVDLYIGREDHKVGAMGLELVKVLVRSHLVEAVNARFLR